LWQQACGAACREVRLGSRRESLVSYKWSGVAQRADFTADVLNRQQRADFVAKVGCNRRMSFGHSLEPTGVDPPTLCSRRNSYATQYTEHELVVVGQPTTRGA
jgi:hypothetical protein